jgi:hypothetical protein
MRLSTLAFTGCLGLALAACVSQPVVVIGKDGRILKGTVTAAASGAGSFSVSDAGLSCSGGYNALDRSPTITMDVGCSDGRRGTVVANRESGLQTGSGTVTLNDGYTATFIFGPQANDL